MFLDKDLSEQLSGEFKRWVKERERGGIPPGSPMDVRHILSILLSSSPFSHAHILTLLAFSSFDQVVDERGTPHSHHPRRKSDSVVDFVETGDGRVTPRSTSPKLHQVGPPIPSSPTSSIDRCKHHQTPSKHQTLQSLVTPHPNRDFLRPWFECVQGMRYIGLHDASPLQMLLAKRIFADKNKRYKTNDHQHPSSSASQAGGASSAGSITGRTARSQVPTPSHLHPPPPPPPPHLSLPSVCQYFFGEEEWDHLSAVPSGASGVLSTAGSEALGGALLVPGEEALPEVGCFAFVLTGGSWPFETTNTVRPLPTFHPRIVGVIWALFLKFEAID
jgi:hypothetical protein